MKGYWVLWVEPYSLSPETLPIGAPYKRPPKELLPEPVACRNQSAGHRSLTSSSRVLG